MNVFEEVKAKGHDIDFVPNPANYPVQFRCGSVGKIEAMRERLERGEDLHHDDDNTIHATVEEQHEVITFLQQVAINTPNPNFRTRQIQKSLARKFEYANDPKWVAVDDLQKRTGYGREKLLMLFRKAGIKLVVSFRVAYFQREEADKLLAGRKL